jgi:hypothetical protein
VGSSPRRCARAGKSRRRQTGEGVEAGVEVNVEVPGTRAVLGVEQVWPEAAVDGGRGTTAMAARVEWRELDGNCGKRSEWLFLRTDGEGAGCTGDGCMCSAWSGGGGWLAASTDSVALRWRAAEQLSCTQGASVRTSA